MKEKALALLETPDIKLQRFRRRRRPDEVPAVDAFAHRAWDAATVPCGAGTSTGIPPSAAGVFEPFAGDDLHAWRKGSWKDCRSAAVPVGARIRSSAWRLPVAST